MKQKKIPYLFIFIHISNFQESSLTSISPQIVTKPAEISKPKGETVKFHCKVIELGDRHLVWRRGYSVLATGHIIVSPDPRVSVLKHGGVNILKIENINEGDAGDYVCQISLLTDIVSVQHTLDVLVGSSIVSVPSSGNMTVTEGEDVTLRCEVSGNPLPSVRWSKTNGNNRELPMNSHNSCPQNTCLSLPSVTKSSAGFYQCTADNGVGKATSGLIGLKVQYAPSLNVQKQSVSAGLGSQVSLACEVEGEPSPSVEWFLTGQKIRLSPPEVVTRQSSNRHSLILTRIDLDMFGNYSCVASNRIGSTKKYIEVHGRPSAVNFSSIEESKRGNYFVELSWQVESFVPILEYRLLYRRLLRNSNPQSRKNDSDWTNVIIPGAEFFSSGTQDITWRLDNLQTNTKYECLAQARNKFGWSHASKMFTFTTLDKVIQGAATQGFQFGSTSSAPSLLNFGIIYISPITFLMIGK